MPACEASTQGRRRPIGRKLQRSMMGPLMSFRLHGRMVIARKEPMAAGLTPCSAMYAGIATESRP